MHDLASFSKIQLIRLAFKGFFLPHYCLAAMLFKGNKLTTSLQMLVNLGDNYMIQIKQLQRSILKQRSVSLDLLNVSFVPWTLLIYQYLDNFVCRTLLDLSETLRAQWAEPGRCTLRGRRRVGKALQLVPRVLPRRPDPAS